MAEKDASSDVLSAALGEAKKERILHRLSVAELPPTQPTLSLHMLVKNAQQVISRTISHVLPYLSEVHVVLNDTDDMTESEIMKTLAGSKVSGHIRHVNQKTHPEFYIHDVPETYEEAGPALAGEEFLGPCTGQWMLADWSAVRNLGWSSDADYKLQLDADDLLVAPESLPVALKAMHSVGADLVASPYHVHRTAKTVYRERIARSTPLIKWDGKIHDKLSGGLRRLLVEDLLVTVDMRDNKGTGTRVVGRDFKILYYLARKQGWKVSLRHYLYLIQEAKHLMPLGWVVGPLLDRYRQEFDAYGDPSRLPEKSFVYSMMGDLFDEQEEWYEASRWYERAITAHPTKSGHWKLCKVLHLLGQFERCVSTWERSLVCNEVATVLDLTPTSEAGTKVIVANSLSLAGRHQEALTMITDVYNGHPQPGVVDLKNLIEKRLAGVS
jgi:hypothetical protein